MMSNVDEFWAEGTQAWFDATVRTDVNSGVNTRVKLKAHDPQLAAVLAHVFGDGPWRYGHTSKKQFGDTPSIGYVVVVVVVYVLVCVFCWGVRGGNVWVFVVVYVMPVVRCYACIVVYV